MNLNWSYNPETLDSDHNWWFFFVSCELQTWRMILKNNRAPFLCYFELCASFCSHLWIQTGVTARNCPIWVKISDIFSCVTLKFDRWPWKTIGHLFYVTSRFVHHCVAICVFKLELQSRNPHLGHNRFFVLCDLGIWWMILKTIGHLFHTTSSFVYHFIAIGDSYSSETPNSGQNRRYFVPCDLEI